tara:strand:+ start:532 stop:861 length:330 start_codon:yes stop_codon:yes gene_type:complete
MALRVEYETNYGITCEYAYCVIRDIDVKKKVIEIIETENETSISKLFEVRYNGLVYASEDAYEGDASPVGGFNYTLELNNAATKQQYNIVKQCYLHLKEQDGFTDSVDC